MNKNFKKKKGSFSWKQMEEIRLGFECGLSNEQIATYAKPEFDYHQMREIRWGFEQGLTMYQVELYANSNNDWEVMEAFRLSFDTEMLPSVVHAMRENW